MKANNICLPSATTYLYHGSLWYHSWYTPMVSWVVELLVSILSKERGERDLKSLFLRTKCRGFFSSAQVRVKVVERRHP